ncbi:MAG: response regulator receiver protein [Candidatus Saccharibacteria bacterium]|nr:response regulator receiver protein [Candidatus Saccharibacteria bacterium]
MKKILVADDNPAILDALKIMLEDEGYEVETTEDGAVAQNMKAPLPDLLLLDVWMSGIDGRDVCQHLKAAAATKHIPVILISAAKNIDRIAKDAGADDFISKPFQMKHLLATVAVQINKQKLRRKIHS